jgi:hypothetical protein
MPRPRRTRQPGPIHGDNGRPVSDVQAIIAPGLEAWMKAIGHTRLRMDVSMISKIATLKTRLPKKAGDKYAKLTRLAPEERAALNAAAGLCHSHPDGLAFISKNYEAKARQLNRELLELAKLHPQAPKAVYISKHKRRHRE